MFTRPTLLASGALEIGILACLAVMAVLVFGDDIYDSVMSQVPLK